MLLAWKKWGAGAVLLSACLSAVGATSAFSSDTEGWTAIGDVEGPLTWSATGGNPGGYVYIDDLTTGGVTYFSAPSSFLADLRSAGAYGSSLGFDLRQDYPGGADQFDTDDVVIVGGGLTLAYDLAVNPAKGAWTSFSVPFLAGGWRVGSIAGAVATEAQLVSVLSNLSELRIRAEYQTGSDIGGLDNVSAVPEPEKAAMFALGGALLAVMRQRRRRS